MQFRTAQVLALLLGAATALLAADPPKADPKADPANPGDDPIATELLKDKKVYIASLDKARDDVLKAFDKYYETVKSNKSMKIEAQLAQLEKLEAEKKLFEDRGVFPVEAAMKVAVGEYRTTQKKAEVVCKAAFDKAAKAYRDKGDLKLAGATLNEMKEFLAKTGAGAAVVFACGNSNKVLGLSGGVTDNGTKIVACENVKGDQTLLWKVIPAGDGYVYIENVKTGLVMSVNGKANGTELAIAKKQTPASDSQLWKLTPVPTIKDMQKVFSKASGKLLAINARGTEVGTTIVLWPDAAPQIEMAHMFGLYPPK